MIIRPSLRSSPNRPEEGLPVQMIRCDSGVRPVAAGGKKENRA